MTTYPRTATMFLMIAISNKTLVYKGEKIEGELLAKFVLLERRLDIILGFGLGACFGAVITQLAALIF